MNQNDCDDDVNDENNKDAEKDGKDGKPPLEKRGSLETLLSPRSLVVDAEEHKRRTFDLFAEEQIAKRRAERKRKEEEARLEEVRKAEEEKARLREEERAKAREEAELARKRGDLKRKVLNGGEGSGEGEGNGEQTLKHSTSSGSLGRVSFSEDSEIRRNSTMSRDSMSSAGSGRDGSRRDSTMTEEEAEEQRQWELDALKRWGLSSSSLNAEAIKWANDTDGEGLSEEERKRQAAIQKKEETEEIRKNVLMRLYSAKTIEEAEEKMRIEQAQRKEEALAKKKKEREQKRQRRMERKERLQRLALNVSWRERKDSTDSNKGENKDGDKDRKPSLEKRSSLQSLTKRNSLDGDLVSKQRAANVALKLTKGVSSADAVSSEDRSATDNPSSSTENPSSENPSSENPSDILLKNQTSSSELLDWNPSSSSEVLRSDSSSKARLPSFRKKQSTAGSSDAGKPGTFGTTSDGSFRSSPHGNRSGTPSSGNRSGTPITPNRSSTPITPNRSSTHSGNRRPGTPGNSNSQNPGSPTIIAPLSIQFDGALDRDRPSPNRDGSSARPGITRNLGSSRNLTNRDFTNRPGSGGSRRNWNSSERNSSPRTSSPRNSSEFSQDQFPESERASEIPDYDDTPSRYLDSSGPGSPGHPQKPNYPRYPHKFNALTHMIDKEIDALTPRDLLTPRESNSNDFQPQWNDIEVRSSSFNDSTTSSFNDSKFGSNFGLRPNSSPPSQREHQTYGNQADWHHLNQNRLMPPRQSLTPPIGGTRHHLSPLSPPISFNSNDKNLPWHGDYPNPNYPNAANYDHRHHHYTLWTNSKGRCPNTNTLAKSPHNAHSPHNSLFFRYSSTENAGQMLNKSSASSLHSSLHKSPSGEYTALKRHYAQIQSRYKRDSLMRNMTDAKWARVLKTLRNMPQNYPISNLTFDLIAAGLSKPVGRAMGVTNDSSGGTIPNLSKAKSTPLPSTAMLSDNEIIIDNDSDSNHHVNKSSDRNNHDGNESKHGVNDSQKPPQFKLQLSKLLSDPHPPSHDPHRDPHPPSHYENANFRHLRNDVHPNNIHPNNPRDGSVNPRNPRDGSLNPRPLSGFGLRPAPGTKSAPGARAVSQSVPEMRGEEIRDSNNSRTITPRAERPTTPRGERQGERTTTPRGFGFPGTPRGFGYTSALESPRDTTGNAPESVSPRNVNQNESPRNATAPYRVSLSPIKSKSKIVTPEKTSQEVKPQMTREVSGDSMKLRHKYAPLPDPSMMGPTSALPNPPRLTKTASLYSGLDPGPENATPSPNIPAGRLKTALSLDEATASKTVLKTASSQEMSAIQAALNKKKSGEAVTAGEAVVNVFEDVTSSDEQNLKRPSLGLKRPSQEKPSLIRYESQERPIEWTWTRSDSGGIPKGARLPVLNTLN